MFKSDEQAAFYGFVVALAMFVGLIFGVVSASL